MLIARTNDVFRTMSSIHWMNIRLKLDLHFISFGETNNYSPALDYQ